VLFVPFSLFVLLLEKKVGCLEGLFGRRKGKERKGKERKGKEREKKRKEKKRRKKRKEKKKLGGILFYFTNDIYICFSSILN